jgi:hypothetical protein
MAISNRSNGSNNDKLKEKRNEIETKIIDSDEI